MILDDRIARQSAGGALAKLRLARKRSHDGSSCFLYPGGQQACKQPKAPAPSPPQAGLQYLGDVSAGRMGRAAQAQELLSRLTPSPVLTAASSPSPTASSPSLYAAAAQLPINLSTLMPVPLREVRPPPPQQEHAALNGLVSTATASTPAPLPWQGVEAVAESYRAYNQGTHTKLLNR